MISLLRLIIFLILPLVLTSCSYFSKQTILSNRDKQYLSAKSIPPLRMPPGVSSSAFHNDYPVSNRYYPEAEKKVSIVPPGL
jgi:uncharacterized lipoprotein